MLLSFDSLIISSVMIYKNIRKAEFISRPNRFVAICRIDGEECRVHVKNTGRCRELLVPGAAVWLEDFNGRMGKRKLRYSLIAVQKGDLLINMDSQAPNQVVSEALGSGKIQIPGIEDPVLIQREKTFDHSRFDFYLENREGEKCFAEVKGVTLESDGIAMFPDAPTERGVKHLHELIEARRCGYTACIIFVIQMKGIRWMHPNDITHREFGEALRTAAAQGVSVLAYDCIVTETSLDIDSPVEVRL